MFSIITPTIWRGLHFKIMLPVLLEHNLVGEVILIDNDVSRTPSWVPLDHPKLVYLPQQKNIYVNPAWNLGCAKASCDQLCFLSDDVGFDVRVLDWLNGQITPEVGCFGPTDHSKITDAVEMPASTPLELTPASRHTQYYGCFFFLHRSNYAPIPEEFLIYYGDTWLFDFCAGTKKQNFYFRNVRLATRLGTTSGNLSNITNQDESEFNTKYRRLLDKYIQSISL